jgi:transmembrane sensor
MQRKTAHEIDQEAAEWAARVDRGLSSDEQSDLDAWLAGDVRRVGAYGRMRAIALRTERAAALGSAYRPADFAPRRSTRPSRRKLLLAGGAMAAGMAGAAVLGWTWYASGRFQTRKGQMRQVALADGSVVTLNTASLVSVDFSGRRREVRLLTGEALFDVAHDKARPFVVVAGMTEARAVGTSFSVLHLPGKAVQVLVREGVVEVTRTDEPTAAPMRVNVNMCAISSAETPRGAATALSVAAVPEEGVSRALAWRDGRIAFEGETLAAAAAEFARYSDIRIVVEDPALAREEIAGLYETDDPVGFARAVAASLRAQAEVSDGAVRISRPASS